MCSSDLCLLGSINAALSEISKNEVPKNTEHPFDTWEPMRPDFPAGGRSIEAASNQQFTKVTLPFTQITGGKRADSGVLKVAMAFNLLKRSGAGDGTRTRDVQLGNPDVYWI